jgi:rhodanese-related sulfurtransferase
VLTLKQKGINNAAAVLGGYSAMVSAGFQKVTSDK